jgi:hypothetical protein
MIKTSTKYKNIASGLFFISLFSSVLPATAMEFEKTEALKAAAFLPGTVLSNSLYTIDEQVTNDGFINTYTVNSTQNSFKVSSNRALQKLLLEIEAISAMRKVEKSDVFINSLKESGAATVDGLKKLITAPADTIENAVSGLGSLFSLAEESIFNSSPGESEDSRLEQTIGFSNAKREVAFRYKVDVYSQNTVLQEHLDRIAWAEYAGGLTLGVATMPVGGVAGATLTFSGTTRLLGEIIATTPPAELKLKNRQKLSELGIKEDLADLFIENPHFSPLQQTAFVLALEKVKTAPDRSLPLLTALQVTDQEMAGYMTSIMLMFSGYNSQIVPVVRFKTVARVFGAIDKNGKMIIMLPADFITWNKRLANTIDQLKGTSNKTNEIWITGTASPLATKNISASGWHLKQKVTQKIGFNEIAKK